MRIAYVIFFVPSNICLGFYTPHKGAAYKANSLVATFASCRPYAKDVG